MHRGGRGQAEGGLGAASVFGDEDPEVVLAQADEHVLVGDVVTDREHDRALRPAVSEP